MLWKNVAWKASGQHFAGSGPISLSWELILLLLLHMLLPELYYWSVLVHNWCCCHTCSCQTYCLSALVQNKCCCHTQENLLIIHSMSVLHLLAFPGKCVPQYLLMHYWSSLMHYSTLVDRLHCSAREEWVNVVPGVVSQVLGRGVLGDGGWCPRCWGVMSQMLGVVSQLQGMSKILAHLLRHDWSCKLTRQQNS